MFWDLRAAGCWQSVGTGGGRRTQPARTRQHLLSRGVCNTSWLLFALGPVRDFTQKTKDGAYIRVSINAREALEENKLEAAEPPELVGAKPCC